MDKLEKAYFSAGCFWGVESLFRGLNGVVDAKVGYMGGNTQDPNYQEVCTGKTGHAETVMVLFDPIQLSYIELLHNFWKCHDPSTLNRQGYDIGSQYRSAIFYTSEEQKLAAIESRSKLQNKFNEQGNKRTIVTLIEPEVNFYLAEEYHQRYLDKKGLNSCSL
ncbi:MAG: peptide-methionine (S)-S-oxide reductase MsrA [Oligoflexales bacterium]